MKRVYVLMSFSNILMCQYIIALNWTINKELNFCNNIVLFIIVNIFENKFFNQIF